MINFLKSVLLVLIMGGFLPRIQAQSAAELLKNMDNLMSAPKDRQADVKMLLTSRDGSQKKKEANLLQKGPDKKLYRYTKSSEKEGIATLFLPGGVMWIYMPSFNAPMKVSILSKSQAFNGTDFSYEDMSGIPYSERFTPSLLNSDIANTYLLELIPKSSKSNYSKILVYLDKKNHYPIKMNYYNKSNRADKIALYKYAKNGNYWYAQEVTMTDLKTQHSTSIILSNVKFDQGLSDDVFTVKSLKK